MPQKRSPLWLDRRSQALKSLVAKALRANPNLLMVGSENIARWRDPDGRWGHHTHYMNLWMSAINQGVEACCAILEDTSVDNQPMLSSAPFAGVVSEKDRLNLLAHWEEKE